MAKGAGGSRRGFGTSQVSALGRLRNREGGINTLLGRARKNVIARRKRQGRPIPRGR